MLHSLYAHSVFPSRCAPPPPPPLQRSNIHSWLCLLAEQLPELEQVAAVSMWDQYSIRPILPGGPRIAR